MVPNGAQLLFERSEYPKTIRENLEPEANRDKWIKTFASTFSNQRMRIENKQITSFDDCSWPERVANRIMLWSPRETLLQKLNWESQYAIYQVKHLSFELEFFDFELLIQSFFDRNPHRERAILAVYLSMVRNSFKIVWDRTVMMLQI